MASAAFELRRASDLQPESLEYLLYAIWAERAAIARCRPNPINAAARARAEGEEARPDVRLRVYVIGQLSMPADDDATAKKWFYEALRLDPASEAGAGPDPRAAWRGARRLPAERSSRATTRLQCRLPFPPVKPPAAAPPARAPSRPAGKRGKGVVTGAALIVATGAFVISPWREEAGLRASPGELPPAITVDAAHRCRIDGADASAPATGALEARASRPGRRDGDGEAPCPRVRASHLRRRPPLQADGAEPLRLRCGAHVVQIETGGTAETIDVPCGGEVQLQ